MVPQVVSQDRVPLAMLQSAEEALLTRVRGEFSEMPGMRLTLDQAMRLWSLDRATCDDVLRVLIASRFLERGSDGRYRRAHGGY